MKTAFFILFLSGSLLSFSQEDAWVFLSDKENVSASIANPISILTQKAIDRKNTHNVAIDERDVPVNESYIYQLKNQSGISVLAKSKWFNAVHVRGSINKINSLLNLDFVNEVKFANSSLNSRIASESKDVNKFEFERVFTDFEYGNASNQIEMIKGDDLHLADFTGENMTVAIIDAGFPGVNTIGGFQRVRNLNNILGTYNFVNRDDDVYTNTDTDHGTHVFSNMAGYIQNQFVGTAPDAQYYLFITESIPNENPVEESWWVEAAERADSLGVDVINTSLSYKEFDNSNYNYSSSDLDGDTAFMTKGANIASEKGMLLVVGAGNSGSSGVGSPADAAGVISIGAVKANGTYASFSSQGSAFQPTQKPDVVAQGEAIYVINENNVISAANGTSYSSPILAGGIVCLWQALPNLNNGQIMQLVRESASQYNNPDYYLGYGIPDLSQAMSAGQLLMNQEIQKESIQVNVFPNPASQHITVNLPNNFNFGNLRLFNILGKKVLDIDIKDKSKKLSISKFSSGIYLLKIKAESDTKVGITKTMKLIIK